MLGLAGGASLSNAQTLIDFEHFPDGSAVPSGALLRAQFQAWGVVFNSTDGSYGGRATFEGQDGVQNFGNSSHVTVDIGNYGQSTTIQFVDPTTGSPRPVSRVRLLVGDGDVDSETFSVVSYDSASRTLHSSGCVRTYSNGYLYDFDSGVPNIEYVGLSLMPRGTGACQSSSGAVFDDLYFETQSCGAAPTISDQSGDQSICLGSTASFSVTASGTPAPTYQWQWQPEPGGVWMTVAEGDNFYQGQQVFHAEDSGTAFVRVNLFHTWPNRYNAPALRCAVSNTCGSASSNPAALYYNSADFNGDGDLGTDTDIEAFFACLGGNCCPACGSADFNGDGDIGTDADIEAFFRVLGGGAC
jgi:hypothetical protein